MIYLDNSTLARPSEQTLSRILPFFSERWGCPTAPHQKGQELHSVIKESYKAIYALIGAKDEDTLIFSSSGAEAVRRMLRAVYQDVTLATGKNQFITSSLDEAPAILAVGDMKAMGIAGRTAKADPRGFITAEAVAEQLSPRSAIVSISWANGLTGVVQPIEEIKALCRQRGVLLHIDATHVLGKLFYELEEVGADFITFNGEALHAPQGTGGLYIRQEVKCPSLTTGGPQVGSWNMPGLVGLAAAAHEALESRDFVCTEVARLRNKFEEGLVQGLPEAKVLFSEQERLPHCCCVAFPGVVSEALLFALNRKRLYACMGGGYFQQIGLLLKESGVPLDLAQSALSFSLSRYTAEQEIDKAIGIVVESVRALQNISKHILKGE